MSSYESKLQARKDSLEGRAAKALDDSAASYSASQRAVAGIEMGQPILVGHHSEGRHRRALRMSHNAMRKSCEMASKAKELQRRADAVGTGGVSSDDDKAIEKLQVQLDSAVRDQDLMKSINKILRKKGTDEAKIAALVALKLNPADVPNLLIPDRFGELGFPSYKLTNNNANIKRIEGRIATLKAVKARSDKTVEHDGFTYEEDVSDNRVKFIFPGKPAEAVRKKLSSNGFKYSPTRNAWIRMLNGNGLYAAKCVAEWLKENLQKTV